MKGSFGQFYAILTCKSMRHFATNVVKILKIGAEEEGVLSSRRGAMPGNSCNQSKKIVCSK